LVLREFELQAGQVRVESMLNSVGRGNLRGQGAGHDHSQALLRLGKELEEIRERPPMEPKKDSLLAVGTFFGFFKEIPTFFDGLSSRLPPPPREKRRGKRRRT
jgi:hypothetical protein